MWCAAQQPKGYTEVLTRCTSVRESGYEFNVFTHESVIITLRRGYTRDGILPHKTLGDGIIEFAMGISHLSHYACGALLYSNKYTGLR